MPRSGGKRGGSTCSRTPNGQAPHFTMCTGAGCEPDSPALPLRTPATAFLNRPSTCVAVSLGADDNLDIPGIAHQ